MTRREPPMPHRIVVDDKAQRVTQIEIVKKRGNADGGAVSGERASTRAQVAEKRHEIMAKPIDPLGKMSQFIRPVEAFGGLLLDQPRQHPFGERRAVACKL